MSSFVIEGGYRLSGEIVPQGAKNEALEVICATLLTPEKVTIHNVPDILDVNNLIQLLRDMRVKVEHPSADTYTFQADDVDMEYLSTEEFLRKSGSLRGSVMIVGPLVARFGRALIPKPGGDKIGRRRLDTHFVGIQKLGACFSYDAGRQVYEIEARQLKGAYMLLDEASVTGTANILMAAVLAEGTTILENVAREPHIVDLANFLNMMGADVHGAGTDVIKVHGVKQMHGCNYSIIPDQIEAGSYMVAAAITKGDIMLHNVIPKHMEPITAKLRAAGCEIEEFDDALRITRSGELKPLKLKTMPHPGFPTDMQPLMTALLTLAKGTSIVTEGIWENRFRYVDELVHMGANIQVDGQVAVIEGVRELHPAPLRATDLRAGAAMVMAALAANGVSEVDETIHIERGYENIVEKLQALGADIRRVEIPANAVSRAI